MCGKIPQLYFKNKTHLNISTYSFYICDGKIPNFLDKQ